MTDTRPPADLDKSPFVGLFKKHPWLVPVMMEFRRALGILDKFIEIHVKPFTRKDM